jgi:hypothetical protein
VKLAGEACPFIFVSVYEAAGKLPRLVFGMLSFRMFPG